jgi:hypothetical protein
MDVIIFSSVARDNLAMKPADATFTVTQVGGGPLPVRQNSTGASFVELPDSPRPLQLRVDVTPGSVNHFPISGHFEYRGDGVLVAIADPSTNAPTDRAEFIPVMGASVAQGKAVLLISFLSRVRDATEQTLDSLRNIPRIRQPIAPSDFSWDADPMDLHIINASVLSGSNLAFDQQNVDPNTEVVILRLKVKSSEAPQLLAVMWPKDLERTAGASPTPFLMYFHSGATQNRGTHYEIPGVGTYPNGWDYIFFGLLRYVMYFDDPLAGGDAPFTKGLCYQTAASGKKLVTVLPMNRVFQEVGILLSARSMEEVLLEIQSFMFRRKGIFAPPGLGRTALGAFSSGNPLVTSFLARNQTDPFCQDTLKEVYMFDAGDADKDPWAAQVNTWLRSGDPSTKMTRVYVQTTTGALGRLIGNAALARSPFVASSPNNQRTLAVIPSQVWKSALSAAGGRPPKNDFQSAHQLVSATLLTDALRRSGF